VEFATGNKPQKAVWQTYSMQYAVSKHTCYNWQWLIVCSLHKTITIIVYRFPEDDALYKTFILAETGGLLKVEKFPE
jgi:hypothetical protein